MPKYLFEAKYTPEGVRGLHDAGASSRAKAVNDMAAALGGGLDSFYFAFGDVDAYVIVDLPDDEAAAAAAFAVGANRDDAAEDREAADPRRGRRCDQAVGRLPPSGPLTEPVLDPTRDYQPQQ